METVGRAKTGLPANEKEKYLDHWRVGSFNLDLSHIVRIMYEETFFALLFGLLVIIAEVLVLPTIEEHQGSPWLILLPLAFFGFTILIRPFEERIVQIVNPRLMSYDSRRGARSNSSAYRVQRIVQDGILLGVILLLNASPPAKLFDMNFKLEFDLMKVLEWTSWQYLRFWLNFGKKFQGACAMIILYRLYTDITIQASTYLIGYPAAVPERQLSFEMEVEKLPSERGAYPLRERDSNENTVNSLNGNVTNGALGDRDINMHPRRMYLLEAEDNFNY